MNDRGMMPPLTDATIAYVVGGTLEVRDATTVIINRELTSCVRADAAESTDAEPAPSSLVSDRAG